MDRAPELLATALRTAAELIAVSAFIASVVALGAGLGG